VKAAGGGVLGASRLAHQALLMIPACRLFNIHLPYPLSGKKRDVATKCFVFFCCRHRCLGKSAGTLKAKLATLPVAGCLTFLCRNPCCRWTPPGIGARLKFSRGCRFSVAAVAVFPPFLSCPHPLSSPILLLLGDLRAPESSGDKVPALDQRRAALLPGSGNVRGR